MEYRRLQHLSVVAIEKGAFGSPSTTVTNFTFTYYLGVLKFPGNRVVQVICFCVEAIFKKIFIGKVSPYNVRF